MWLYYVIGPGSGTLYRMTSNGSKCETWAEKKWTPDEDSALVGALVKGEVYLRKVTEAEAERLEH